MDAPTGIVTENDTQQTTHDAGCMNNIGCMTSSSHRSSTDCNKREQGPDYKHQCQSFIPTINSSLINIQPSENQEHPIQCSDTSSSPSSSTTHPSYIPFVYGVLLPEDQTVIAAIVDTHNDDYNTTNTATNPNLYTETEAPGIFPSPEQAPVPQIISVKRKSFESKQSTLSNAEKRYWIKVVVIAIIVNTLIVMGGVIGGVCGISGCNFSHNDENNVALGNDMYGDIKNVTNTPTPAPSRRLVGSDYPVMVSVNAPTVPDNNLDESITFPSASPEVTLQPTIFMTVIGDIPSTSPVNKLVVILPVAILLDALFTVAYLFYHYNKWIRRKSNTEP